ncbi:isoprenylcysteine carboxylmethyltransferase family protein [Candidatus Micrarchaeota archaeon]|nr:isoprenylcysteine carboxylmethyltransferase family protein [Candidatus Micrarchaeota archaeon]
MVFVLILLLALYYLPSAPSLFSSSKKFFSFNSTTLLMLLAYGSSLLFVYSTWVEEIDLLALSLASGGIILHFFAVFGLKENWSAGIRKSNSLNTKGIYSIVRHPAYNAAFLFYSGLALNSKSVEAIIIVGTYLLVRITIEEKELRKHFGPAYIEYSKKVPATLLGLVFKPL